MIKKDFSYNWNYLADDRRARERYPKVMKIIKNYNSKISKIVKTWDFFTKKKFGAITKVIYRLLYVCKKNS